MVWRSNPGGGKIFHTHPGWSWGPPSLLYNGYQLTFPGLKWLGWGIDHPPPFSTQVKKSRAIPLFPSGQSCLVVGWTFTIIKSNMKVTLMKYILNPYHEGCSHANFSVKSTAAYSWILKCNPCGRLNTIHNIYPNTRQHPLHNFQFPGKYLYSH